MVSVNGTRKSYLDVLRIFAAFLVVFNHTEGFHLFLSQAADGSVGSWLRVIISVFTTINIPIFFMVSGALLLGKDESYLELFRKRILRILIVLAVFSALIYIMRDGGMIFSMDFIRALLAGEITLSYWFLFAYLGFLFSLPFLRKIGRNMTNKDFLFLVVLQFCLTSALPAYRYWCGAQDIQPVLILSDFQMPFSTMMILFYPLVGYHLSTDKFIKKFEAWHIACFLGVMAVSVGFASIITYHQGVHSGFSQDYLSLFTNNCAIVVFLLARYVCECASPSPLVRKVLSAVSGVTFGVYLLEPLLNFYLYYAYGSSVNRMLYSVLWCFFSMFVCGAVTFLIKKIPVIGKLL